MRTYNITKNLNTNSGRNKYSISIGTTRNIRGSSNRIFQYCKQNSDDPFYCMFGIVKPSPPRPIRNCLNGYVSYSYTYTGSGQISEAVVKQNLPVYTISDIIDVNPEITVIGNTVYVEITTCLYELPSYPDDVGISLNSNPDIVNFINNNTNGITFTASSNCPFAKNGSQFKGVNNLTITQAKGIKGTKRFREITYFTPYFLPGTSLSGCFQNCTNFNSNISGWDTTNVTDMSSMFNGATAFNQNINSWNTSNVTNMSYMFYVATYFNQNIGSLDVSKVTTMQSMFYKATSFNNGESPDIQNWKAHLCINFYSMFSEASNFNQPLTNLVDTTNVVSCNMFQMFYKAELFNQSLNSWNTSNVTNMQATFNLATSFNQPLNNWNTSNVTNMTNMFREASSFNENISSWYAPKCTSFTSMFENALKFNQPLPNLVDASDVDCSLYSMFNSDASFNQNIGNWNVSNVTNMTLMFNQAYTFNNGGSDSIKNWYAPKCISFNGMFRVINNSLSHRFNQPLPILVDTSGVDSCSLASMFLWDSSFNQNIGGWNVSNVTNMANMFNSAYTFNNGGSDSIKNWYAPKCTNFSGMFLGFNTTTLTHRFNQPLPNLVDTYDVTNCLLNSMFQNDTSFNQNVGAWNVSNVTNMASMFQSASQFNNDASNSIQSWRAPNCINFSSMFNGASRFNQPLPNLVDTYDVTNCLLISMFASDTSFNQNVGAWNVSNVTSMASMFQSASQFNNDASNSIQSWRAPNCINFSSMFNGASRFNQPLPNLVDTYDVTNCLLISMFASDTSFNQNVGAWNVSNVTSMSSMFQSASMFNNGGSSDIQNWYAPKCISFINMFNGASRFNQPLPILVDTSGVIDCTLTRMFNSDFSFNQDIGNWNVSNVTSSTSMFSSASMFNNGGSNSIQSWRAPKCTTFSGMFQNASRFNQPLPILVDTSGVSSCILTSMFQNDTSFNQDIGNWNVSNVTNVTSMFQGISLTNKNKFNNGEEPSGITSPMEWTRTPTPIVINFRTNSELTSTNMPQGWGIV